MRVIWFGLTALLCAAVVHPGAARAQWPVAGEEFQDCEGCPQMVVIPAGSFRMGSPVDEAGRDEDEGPRHVVIFSRPFAVGKYEVTMNQYRTCAADGGCNGYRPDGRGWPGTSSVRLVSWTEAKLYAEWLSATTGAEYRLLTEAEWEYVARGGTEAEYVTGATTNPAMPNTFGVHDLHGNVMEWVEDIYHANYEGAPGDGRAWLGDGRERVIRGGSYDNRPVIVRNALRGHGSPGFRDFYLGFRVARTLAGP